jgi:enoyl-CoA hydratase/carnithine racemase
MELPSAKVAGEPSAGSGIASGITASDVTASGVAKSGPASGIVQARLGAVLQLGFDRTERRNAITAEMYSVLAASLDEAASAPEIRVVVLHGSADVFTAGNDLGDFLRNPPAAEDSPVLRFLQSISRFPKPLIAAVNGPAVGVGTTMLLHCDLVYAGDGAQFSLPFVRLGLCPEAGSSLLLPLLAGYARAAEKLLFGEPFDVNEARAMGLVNQVLAAAQVLPHALERAQALAQLPVASLLQTKRLLRAPFAAQVSTAMADENATFRRMLTEPAAREAFEAFLQKRKPDFS